MMSIVLILIFVLIFFTLYGHAVRYTEVHNALELSMKHAMAQLQFDEGGPATEEKWLEDFVQSLSLQINSQSDLTIHIYEADMEHGLLSAEAILTFQNPIGTTSSISTEKRTMLLEEYSVTVNNYPMVDAANTYVTESAASAADITPSQQALLDAGYGVVILLPTGHYGVLMQGPDHKIDGKDGGELLIDYLTERKLQGSVSGEWMNDQYYYWIANNITELITPDD